MNESEQVLYDKLLKKSQEAFLVSLELYNKPTILYRVEGFSFFVCNAWELMLKAKILHEKGRDAIYYKDGSGRTLALERCIALVFTNKKDPLRKNLETVARLRNAATHLIVEEYEQIYAPLFQACVKNFDEKMHDFHNLNVSNSVPSNFLTLSMNASPINPELIRAKYPAEIAEQVLFDEGRVFQDMLIEESGRYAMSVQVNLAVVKDPKNADFSVRYDAQSSTPIRTAKVFTDPSTTHPYSSSIVIERVNKALKRGGVELKANGAPKKFTQNDWSLFCKFYELKKDRNYGFCHKVHNTEQYTYTQSTIDFIVELITQNPDKIIDDLKRSQR